MVLKKIKEIFKRRNEAWRHHKKLSSMGKLTIFEKNLILNWLKGTISGRFSLHDVAQQIVGAMILSAPFIVTQEVWELAKGLNEFRIISLIGLTLFVGFFIVRYTQRQIKPLGGDILKRMLSLVIISYTCSFFVLYTVGIIGNVITDYEWAAKLVVLVSLFSTIGAATADIIIFR